MNIAEIREKYPQYNDLSDEALAKGLHAKFYSDMDFGEFSNKIGLTPQINLTPEQKAQIQATKDEYKRKQAERDKDQWFVSLVENKQDDPLKNIARSTARLGLSTMQGIANAGLNPFTEVAEEMGADLKPIKPENAAERTAELAGEYGYDAAALYALSKGVGGLYPKLAPYTAPLTFGGFPLAMSQSLGSALATGTINPESTVGRIATDIIGGGLGSGLARPRVSMPKETKAISELEKTVGKDVLAENVAEAERTGRNLLEVGSDEITQRALQAKLQTPEARKILLDSIEQSSAAQPARTKAVINEALGTEGKNSTLSQVMENAKQEAQPLYKELENIGDLAKYETRDLPQQNFKRWFEGSKVVDENGQPLTYYHGSLRKFDKFNQANNDYNFAPNEKFAYDYAESKGFEQGIDAEPQLYKVFLNSKRPFDFENPEDIKNLSNYIKGKKIRVFGNPKKEEEFLRNLKGEYYDTKLDEGEFEKLLSDKYNKWYSPDNHDVNYEQSSVNTDKIFSVNPDEEYFITGSAPWGYNIDDVKISQIEDAMKNLDFGKYKRHQIPVDIETPNGTRVINIDLKRIDKPSIKNLKKGADNWINIESADFDGEDILDALKNMGYDGYYKQENGVKNLSVFNPNQIKSVDNSGLWSSTPSLKDIGWIPESQSQLARVIKDNDVLADTISKVKRANSSLKNLPDTDFKVVNEARKALSQASMNRTELSGYEARQALNELDPILNNITGGKLAQANKLYSDAYQFERAADLGRGVFNSRVSPDDMKVKIGALTANEKKAARIGLREEILNKIGSTNNQTNALNKLLPENVREKITTLAGEKEGAKIIDEAEQAVKLRNNLNKVFSGSQTAEKGALERAIAGVMNFKSHPVLSTVGSLYTPYNRGINVRAAETLTDKNIANAYRKVMNARNAPKQPKGYAQSGLRSIIERLTEENN